MFIEMIGIIIVIVEFSFICHASSLVDTGASCEIAFMTEMAKCDCGFLLWCSALINDGWAKSHRIIKAKYPSARLILGANFNSPGEMAAFWNQMLVGLFMNFCLEYQEIIFGAGGLKTYWGKKLFGLMFYYAPQPS